MKLTSRPGRIARFPDYSLGHTFQHRTADPDLLGVGGSLKESLSAAYVFAHTQSGISHTSCHACEIIQSLLNRLGFDLGQPTSEPVTVTTYHTIELNNSEQCDAQAQGTNLTNHCSPLPATPLQWGFFAARRLSQVLRGLSQLRPQKD